MAKLDGRKARIRFDYHIAKKYNDTATYLKMHSTSLRCTTA
jgi:hypothetical protein